MLCLPIRQVWRSYVPSTKYQNPLELGISPDGAMHFQGDAEFILDGICNAYPLTFKSITVRLGDSREDDENGPGASPVGMRVWSILHGFFLSQMLRDRASEWTFSRAGKLILSTLTRSLGSLGIQTRTLSCCEKDSLSRVPRPKMCILIRNYQM